VWADVDPHLRRRVRDGPEPLRVALRQRRFVSHSASSSHQRAPPLCGFHSLLDHAILLMNLTHACHFHVATFLNGRLKVAILFQRLTSSDNSLRPSSISTPVASSPGNVGNEQDQERHTNRGELNASGSQIAVRAVCCEFLELLPLGNRVIKLSAVAAFDRGHSAGLDLLGDGIAGKRNRLRIALFAVELRIGLAAVAVDEMRAGGQRLGRERRAARRRQVEPVTVAKHIEQALGGGLAP
jgi:hypothetical protein